MQNLVTQTGNLGTWTRGLRTLIHSYHAAVIQKTIYNISVRPMCNHKFCDINALNNTTQEQHHNVWDVEKLEQKVPRTIGRLSHAFRVPILLTSKLDNNSFMKDDCRDWTTVNGGQFLAISHNTIQKRLAKYLWIKNSLLALKWPNHCILLSIIYLTASCYTQVYRNLLCLYMFVYLDTHYPCTAFYSSSTQKTL